MWRLLQVVNWPAPGWYWYTYGDNAPAIASVLSDHIYFGNSGKPVFRNKPVTYAGKYFIRMPALRPPQ